MMTAFDFDDEWSSPSQWAAMYRRLGFQVVPAGSPKDDPNNYKRPILKWKEFEDSLVPDATWARWYGDAGEYRARANMGLITGLCSGGIFCVDLDTHKEGSAARAWWGDLLAEHCHGQDISTPSQRTGGGGRQLVFRAPDGWEPPTFKTPIGIDIRGRGGFMMAPPSKHLSGQIYDWEPGRGPWQVAVVDAPEWLIDAIDALKLDYARNAGGHGRERTRSDGSKNAFGLDIDEREEKLLRTVWAAILDLYRDSPIPPPQNEQDAEKHRLWQNYLSTTKSRLVDVNSTTADLLEREGRGWSELDRKWRRAMDKWDKEVKQAAAEPRPTDGPEPFVENEPGGNPNIPPEGEAGGEETSSSDGPKPGGQPAFDPWQRYIVPRFPLDLLPPAVRDFVEYQSISVGADPAACAMATLAVCSGALDQRFKLKMRKTGGWLTGPRLWVMLVGDPSKKKSPVISGSSGPLRRIQDTYLAAHKKDVAKWKATPKEARGDEPDSPLRLIFNSITTETVGEILSRQDRGALMIQDEMSGWIGQMDKWSGGKGGASADRSFWAEAFNGGPMNVDRIGRGHIYITNLAVAFLGAVQPDRLSQMADLTSDGLLQRFLPIMMRRGAFPADVPDDAPADAYADLIHRLVNTPPSTMSMDEGGRAAAEEFQRAMYGLAEVDGLGKGFCTFVGKLDGLHGSLSLLLHLISDADARFDPVSERTVRAASRIMEDFVIPHALEFYRSTADKADWHALRTMASFILTSAKDRFTTSDFTNNVRALQGLGVWEVCRQVSPLVAGGWLVEEEKGGVVKAWTVVAGLREAMAARRDTERSRKAEEVKKWSRYAEGVQDDE